MRNFLHVSLTALLLTSSVFLSNAQNTDSVASSAGLSLLPERWSYTPEVSQILPDEDEWWLGFKDSTLDSLMQVGIANNYDLLQAGHRREMARLAIGSARSAYFPTI